MRLEWEAKLLESNKPVSSESSGNKNENECPTHPGDDENTNRDMKNVLFYPTADNMPTIICQVSIPYLLLFFPKIMFL